MTAPNRGRFQKGNQFGGTPQSGRKPDAVLQLRDQINAYMIDGKPATVAAFERLCKIIGSADDDTALKACVAVLNRVLGMPHVSATIESGGSSKVFTLLEQILMARAANHDMRKEPPLLVDHPKALPPRGDTEGVRVKKVKSQPSG